MSVESNSILLGSHDYGKMRFSQKPFEMLRSEWDKAMGDAVEDNVDSEMVYLRFGVLDNAAAFARDVVSGRQRIDIQSWEDLRDTLNSPVTHRQVVEKALKENQPVPEYVLNDYYDIYARVMSERKNKK